MNKNKNETDLIIQLETLIKDTKNIPYKEFGRIFKENGNIPIPLIQFHEIMNFACEQLGFWQTELLFSPAQSPVLPSASLRGEPGTGDGCPSGTAQRR